MHTSVIWRGRRSVRGLMLVLGLLSCRAVDLFATPGTSVTGACQSTDAGCGSTPTGCSNAWCAPEENCELESGRCVKLTPGRCGLPSSLPGGLSTNECRDDDDAGVRCLSGLVCARNFAAVDPQGTFRWSGRCLTACDPCAPNCLGTEECVALPGRGGFCAPGRLAGLGEACGRDICAGPLACANFGRCVNPCIPDDPQHWSAEASTGYVSANCRQDELCQLSASVAGANSFFECVRPIAEVGGPCQGVCPFPSTCLAGVCALDCTTASCPAGVECFTVKAPLFRMRWCIRDGTRGVNQFCAENRNCLPGLRCEPNNGVLKCLPP